MTMSPFITVLIDTYNHERFIEQAIMSVIEQDIPAEEFEILVVDDGSTDRTKEIVRKFAPRVRLLEKENGGQASAISFGVAHAKGDLIAFLDGDDVWLPRKLSQSKKQFENVPDAVMVYHKHCFWDDKTDCTWEPELFFSLSGDILADSRKLLLYSAAPTSSLLFRRQVLERLMPIPDDIWFMADIYLIGTAVCLGPIVGMEDCLTRNRIHGHNLWFAERGEASPEVLKRRVQVRKAAIRSVRAWTRSNAHSSSSHRVEVLLRRWQLYQETDQFRLEPPGRCRYFAHWCKGTRLYSPVMTRSEAAYNWAKTFASLILGYRNLDKVEGVRTRVKHVILRACPFARAKAANQGI